MTGRFLFDGPRDARVTLLMAHGAGAPMDSPAMTTAAQAISAAGLRIARFEFSYMAGRRTSGERKPPPRAETLIGEVGGAIAELDAKGPLIIGGKSMGGRVTSMMADELFTAGKIAGLLCLGYPFHPPDKPAQLRTRHLTHLKTPTLICQGTRDPFGTRAEVAGYDLSQSIELFWLEDGDHDLKPRKRVSGITAADHLSAVADIVAAWTDRIAR